MTGLRTSCLAAAILLLAYAPAAAAGEPEAATSGARSLAELNSSPIQDNSFLVEEAYNQEDGVVQHISFFQFLPATGWTFTQTDEWPLRSLKHQLSLTMAAAHAEGYSGTGWGDAFVNYRYQLSGNGQTTLAVAARVSLLIPTGDAAQGRGMGGPGLQVNLPISIVLTKRLVSHSNIGATWVPHAQDPFHQAANSLGANLGQSFVWLFNPRFNGMLETIWTSNPQVVGTGVTSPQHDLYISPGVRWAYNFKSGLQVVPGIGLPLGLGANSGRQVGAIFYLSFEHALSVAHSKH